MTSLTQAFAECPGLQTFCHRVWLNFAPRRDFRRLETRAARLLARLPVGRLQRELREWRQRGIVPEPDPGNQALVGMLWRSPLFRTLLDTIGYTPPR